MGSDYAVVQTAEIEEAELSAKAERTDAESQRLAEVVKKINAGYQQARDLTTEIDRLGTQEGELFATIKRNATHTMLRSSSSANRLAAMSEMQTGTVQTGNDVGGNVRMVNREPTKEELQSDLSQFVRCHGMAKIHGYHPIAYARDVLKNDRLAQAMDAAGNPAMIPDNYRPIFIELLRPRSVIRRMGPV